MKGFVSKKMQNRAARWIILIGVLAGLFFSGGEGIQLLPFSVLENKAAERPSILSEKRLKSYSYSVNGSGKCRFETASKFQKNDQRRQLDSPLLTASWRSAVQVFYSPPQRNWRTAKLFSRFPVLNPPSDRAPPTV